MASFTPITIVAGTSAEALIRENIRRAVAALATKVHATRDTPMGGNLAAGGFKVQNVDSDVAASSQACTLSTLQAIALL